MIPYQTLINNYSKKASKRTKQFNNISVLRFLSLVAIVLFFYLFYANNFWPYILAAFITVIAFVLLVKQHNKLKWQRKLNMQLLQINNHEYAYLAERKLYYYDGLKYINPKHAYSYDLDLFGPQSLYQNLNRTATFMGEQKLATLMQNKLEATEITLQQEAIKELSEKLHWRQKFLAIAQIANDNETAYTNIINWLNEKETPLPVWKSLLSFIVPIFFAASTIVYFVTYNNLFYQLGLVAFVINTAFFFSQIKKVRNNSSKINGIAKTIYYYGQLINLLEKEDFESEKIKAIKACLQNNQATASTAINKLSGLFNIFTSVDNVLPTTIANGIAQYHIHALKSLLKWKENYGAYLQNWLQIIGNIEALNSLANFSFNNPTFVYPHINSQKNISFKNLGHPLIPKQKSVLNNISFNQNPFVIITGSNMSGKSTFLRSLGVNMLLANIGAVVCAIEATIHPLQILTSMRQTDNLMEGESYFFAEVSRLKSIIEQLKMEPCFILLDEILKGTNSNDKQSGTIGLLQKLLAENAIGCIATHDLEICQLALEQPNYFINKCFEVAVINNELHFDYTIQDGICKNKSATFLMKKMEII